MSRLQFAFAEVYERELVPPLFRPWAEMLLDRAGVTAGQALLDVACGTGIVARMAWERVGPRGRVVGVDGSPRMLAVARHAAPGLDFREAKADALPIHTDPPFDIVTCQQGLQFFPDQTAALREMRRVLRSGGRVAVATWCAAVDNPFIHDLQAVAERHVGPVVDQRYGFGEGTKLVEMLAGAGFQEIVLQRLSYRHHFADGMPFLRLNARALVAMSDRGHAMEDEEKERVVAAIVAASDTVLATHRDPSGIGITFELHSHLAIAQAG